MLTFGGSFRRKMHMNLPISHNIFEVETEILCRVKFEYKYVGGIYLGISQTTGHMSVFSAFFKN